MNSKSKTYALGIDIGGSHITAAIVDITSKKIVPNTKNKQSLDSQQDAFTILNIWSACIKNCLEKFKQYPIIGIGISMPGPANYQDGISEMQGCNKYDKLYGIDLKTFLYTKFRNWIVSPNFISFSNDASCFLAGEAWSNNMNGENIIGITLGTGIGSGFMKNGEIISNGSDMPNNGEVYNLPFKNKRAEDWISTNWFLSTYKEVFGESIKNVKEISEKAIFEVGAQKIFDEFGSNLGVFLNPIMNAFKAETLVFGGNITKSYSLFQKSFKTNLNNNLLNIHFAEDAEDSAILGAIKNLVLKTQSNKIHRLTDQHLMPVKFDSTEQHNTYNVFPSFEISKGKIDQGFDSLAKEIACYKRVHIDGYMGVGWSDFISNLTLALNKLNVEAVAYSTSCAFKDSKEVDILIEDFLGRDDPVFGKLYPGKLQDFLDLEKLENIQPNDNCLSILYGTGASLSSWNAKTIYVDIPKNEIQYRSRAGHVLNLGAEKSLPPKKQYKRMFFVDWPVLNKHKQSILKTIDYVVDAQYIDNISWCNSETLQSGLIEMSASAFRVRPWFEPGIWGGDWIKENIEGLNNDVVNYAWSFEFIVPENGIVFSNHGVRLEVSFDMLMFHDNKAILGDAAKVFEYDFPIRFDFLDTFNGDNLSLQCHPKLDFIKDNFSETFTQDETYYMLDASEDAEVYLGFQEDINKEEFHQALLESNENSTVMDVEKYVQVHPAKKHDLFLIPHGTVHCSGKNGLVLEISSTPYIYTFKMYDWIRKDLDGNPRPLNISRGMENLNFECKGKKVQDDYISKQTVVEQGTNWEIVQLSTHSKHFYDIFRLEFKYNIDVETNKQCHILSLVEGEQIKIVTANRSMIINYAETFVVPADAKKYRLVNIGNTDVKVIQSYVKPEFCKTSIL